MPSDERLPSSAALVPLEAESAEPRHIQAKPRPAVFLAHLIASSGQAPQTRQRRRAEPSEAIAAYTATIARLKAS
jgi:hypothetical protein